MGNALLDEDVPRPEAIPLRDLFVAYRETGDRRVRNDIAERHLHLADFFVKKYRNRGVADDDLRQVALLAMIRGIDRFDPDRGIQFTTFASRTIEGELKRYFRDRTWAVRPPRRMQELHLGIRTAQNELEQRLGRIPTAHDVAAHLGVTLDEVIEAMEAGGAHSQTSIDQSGDDDGPTPAIDRALGASDVGYGAIDDEIVVRNLLDRLPERERTILYLRFFENMTQSEIAERCGISQSYLSRVVRHALADLRTQLERVPT